MIHTIHKIHTSVTDPHSLFAEVTVDSIANDAILIGYNFSNQRTVVYASDIDNLIEALHKLKEVYL